MLFYTRVNVLFYILKLSKKINLLRMATPDLLQRLEKRALIAEQLIDVLRNEVAELKKASESLGHSQLEAENEQLKQEVEEWKSRLIQLELSHGKTQVCNAPPPILSYIRFSNSYSFTYNNLELFNMYFCYDFTYFKVPLPAKNGRMASTTYLASIPTQPPPVEKPPTFEGATQGGDTASDKDKKKEKKAKPATESKEKAGGKGAVTAEEPPVDVGRLDLRVGRIMTAKRHPDADALYVEEVDVGEDKPRTVVSGLVKFVPLEAMQNRLAVLLCNLKPAKMRGVTSEAMVMCASSPDKVEILDPPEGSQPGDEIHVEGYPRVPDPVLNPKKKIFETVAPDLKTDHEGVATYKGSPFTVPGKGVVKAFTLFGVNVK
uniref:tRNA-binding domain-containing protein n=1 Tax=Timema genevievae TaxID=629358 RepID=A0A7R9JVS2_TIMGE|nr:unnamed protein product [Timema genevievae]